MCGIAGFLGFTGLRNEEDAKVVAGHMANTLIHRGPDDSGVWVDASACVALGHRRLSVLDPSPEGRQPMQSSSGRYIVVFNGEIYNFRELRPHLKPYPFHSGSDTEVMLAAFERWGVRESLERFNGMFAFAAWDRCERRLWLARDRVGEKPLYYAWTGDSLLFASELKALRAHPRFVGAIDRDSLAQFLRYGYVPAPHSIYQGVRKLPPGTTLEVKSLAGASHGEPVAYWSMGETAQRGLRDPLRLAEREAEEQLETLLSDAVRLRMVSDVPVGAFLSGGIDSSAVVAFMQRHSRQPVKTFTIGFRETGFDEAGPAREVARYLGTAHTELYVTPREAMAVIPGLPALYDEPFADSSQIPTFLVSRLARQRVTVALSGEGGDEVFGGYTRYLWARRIWRSITWMPTSMRRRAAGVLAHVSPRAWERVYGALDPLLPQSLRLTNPADKCQKLRNLLGSQDPDEMYLRLVSHWDDAASILVDGSGANGHKRLSQRAPRACCPDLLHRWMFLDSVTYLPDDILVKLDRASMGASLESRAPLLDHRILEFAWRLPTSLKVRGQKGKWLLRRVLHRYVPPALVERPKSGFRIPLHEWLRGPLREWAEELLDAGRLQREGFFDPRPIRRYWTDHLSGACNRAASLWNVLMFQAWLEQEYNRRTDTPESMPSVAVRS